MIPPPPQRSFVQELFQEHGLALGAIFLCTVFLASGWMLFADRLVRRAGHAETLERQAERVWGGPLEQPHPTVRWRPQDAMTPELADAEIARSDVAVDLDVEYRRRGATTIPAYRAAVQARYEVRSPSAAPAFLAFSVGLPSEQESLLLHDLALLVDGVADPEHTEYTPQGIFWSGSVAPGAKRTFELTYAARGLERFGYALAPSKIDAIKPLTDFTLRLSTRGAKGQLDYPVGTMSPTAEEHVDGRTVLVWKVDRLLTAFGIGVILPDDSAVAVALRSLTLKAPWFYLLFAGSLLFALSGAGRKARALHVIGLSAPYFLFFPLASYLVGYLHWAIAVGVAFGIAFVLSVLHAARFVGSRAGALVALSEGFFLGLPAVAHLFPAHTGLMLVSGGVVAVAVGLQLLGATARRLRDEPVIEAMAVLDGPPRAAVAR